MHLARNRLEGAEEKVSAYMRRQERWRHRWGRWCRWSRWGRWSRWLGSMAVVVEEGEVGVVVVVVGVMRMVWQERCNLR